MCYPFRTPMTRKIAGLTEVARTGVRIYWMTGGTLASPLLCGYEVFFGLYEGGIYSAWHLLSDRILAFGCRLIVNDDLCAAFAPGRDRCDLLCVKIPKSPPQKKYRECALWALYMPRVPGVVVRIRRFHCYVFCYVRGYEEGRRGFLVYPACRVSDIV